MQQQGSNYFYLQTPPPRPSGLGHKVKIQLFQNMAMFHIKLKGMKHAGKW